MKADQIEIAKRAAAARKKIQEEAAAVLVIAQAAVKQAEKDALAAQDEAKKQEEVRFVPFMISGPGGLVSRYSLPIEVVLERGLFHTLLGSSGGGDTTVVTNITYKDNLLPNGATGTGGTYAFKKGWEGAWEKECDLAGLGHEGLDPCTDDNSFLASNGSITKPPYSHGGWGGYAVDVSDYY